MNPPMQQPGAINVNVPQTRSVPMKRKRGRPRKDQSQSAGRVGGAPQVPPGFERVKPPSSRPRVQELDTMVGQSVTGVIEASFDDGYLLAVRVGNTRTILRGVVFKPGNYVPVSAQNDVAPNARMIHRSPVNLPFVDQTPPPFSMDRNDVYRSQPQAAGASASAPRPKSSALCDVTVVSSAGGRGNVVPVVLQPLGPSNGAPPVIQVKQDAPSSSKGKHKDVVAAEPLAMLPPVISASSSHFQIPGAQQVPVQVQVQGSNHHFPGGNGPMPNDPIRDAAVAARGCEALQPVMASQGSSQSSGSSGGTSNTESDQEPNYFQVSAPNFRGGRATGRMTELLQVLQENFDTPGQVPAPVAGSAPGSQVNGYPEIHPKTERKE